MEPTPTDRACPTCGKRFAPSVDVCPNCGRDSANPFVSPAVEKADRGTEWRWVAAVALGVCILCGALAFVAPGLSVLLLVLAGPVLARARAVVERRREAGLPLNAYERLQALVMSGAMLLLAGLASGVAFFIVCIPAGGAVAVLSSARGKATWIDNAGIVVAFTSCSIAALVAGVYVMRKYWPKRIEKPGQGSGTL
jgi:hypothetical protein